MFYWDVSAALKVPLSTDLSVEILKKKKWIDSILEWGSNITKMWKEWSFVSTFQIHCFVSNTSVQIYPSSCLCPVHFLLISLPHFENECPSSLSPLDLQPCICLCCIWEFSLSLSLVWTTIIFLFGKFYTEDSTFKIFSRTVWNFHLEFDYGLQNM